MFVSKDAPAQVMDCGNCGNDSFGIFIRQGKVVTVCTECKDESHIQVYSELEISDVEGSLCRTGRQPDGSKLP